MTISIGDPLTAQQESEYHAGKEAFSDLTGMRVEQAVPIIAFRVDLRVSELSAALEAQHDALVFQKQKIEEQEKRLKDLETLVTKLKYMIR